MYEVEVKARLKNRQEVVKKLEALGCKFGEELHQIDHVYFPEGLTFPPPIGTGILRVRNQGDKYFFTLKISQSGRQDSIERELEISDGEMMMEIMKLLKYQEAPTNDKKRVKTEYNYAITENIERDGTQQEMNMCAQNEYNKTDSIMNVLYNKIIHRLKHELNTMAKPNVNSMTMI